MSARPPDTTRQNSSGPPPRPRLRPTKAASLVVAALLGAAIGWLIIANDYGDFPTVTWLPALIFAGLGVLELIAAINTKARVDRKPGALPVEPLTAVRYVVLAKASSLVAALFAGFFGAVVLWLFGQPHGARSAPARDLPPSIGGIGGAIVLLVGALLLERACRIPPPPEDDDDSD
jgi:TctA family transporter